MAKSSFCVCVCVQLENSLSPEFSKFSFCCVCVCVCVCCVQVGSCVYSNAKRPSRRLNNGEVVSDREGRWLARRLTSGVVAQWQQIVKTKPEAQWIETTRPLYHLR